jgi:ubiquinone/menaquinone biosynthesis C-methylase UbiE
MNPNADTRDVEEWYAPTRRFAVSVVKKYVRGGKLLELGVNTGVISEQITADSKYGIDIDDSLLAEARKRGITTLKHDLNYPLPFKDSEFDNIIAIESFEHIADYMGLLRESNRVLRKGGHLVIVVPYHGALKNVVASLVEPRHFHNAMHVHFYNPGLLREDAVQTGFRVIETRQFGRLPYIWRVFALVLQK